MSPRPPLARSFVALTAALFVVLSTGACPRSELERTQAFYETRPPFERPQAGQQSVPKGLKNLSAKTCGSCHQAIYSEWKLSTHAHAWRDRQLQAEMKKSTNGWLCKNCHTPLLQQQERWPVGLQDADVDKPKYVPNPNYDAVLADEGITCAACHVRNGTIEGPTGKPTSAHPVHKAARFLSADLCLACHQAVQEYPGKTFTCQFRTGEEWRAGRYGKSNTTCQQCHMQRVQRSVAKGAPSRESRRHYWPGGGIYKEPGDGPPLDQLPSGLAITTATSPTKLIVTLANAGAGHSLPTGDPERFISVEIRSLDAAGKTIGTTTERIGQKWEWWPKPRKLADTRLSVSEQRDVDVPRVPGAVSWEINATAHRISKEALAFHKNDLKNYPASRPIAHLTGRWSPQTVKEQK